MKKILALIIVMTLIFTTGAASAFALDTMDGITDLCSICGEYTDSIGNVYEYSFNLPKVVGTSGYIKQVNEEIDGIYSRIKSNIAYMDGGYSLVFTNVWWDTAEKNGITSLIVAVNNEADCMEYYIYNFDAAGNKVDNAAILKSVVMTEGSFNSRLYSMVDAFMTHDEYKGNPKVWKTWLEARDETLSKDNLNAKVPMFLMEDGTIVCDVTCNVIAGAGYYEYLFAVQGVNGYSKDTAEKLEKWGCVLEKDVDPV